MPIPLLGLALFAGAEYLILKKHKVPEHTVVVPIPPPQPGGMPPVGAQAMPAGIDLVVQLPPGARPGNMITALWTYPPGGPHAGEGGGSTSMPLAWVSPDGTRAAVVFNVTSVPEATVGAIYYARVSSTPLV